MQAVVLSCGDGTEYLEMAEACIFFMIAGEPGVTVRGGLWVALREAFGANELTKKEGGDLSPGNNGLLLDESYPLVTKVGYILLP